ncbi:hypothetical protein BRARA_F00028, partial [Brassica rapa]
MLRETREDPQKASSSTSQQPSSDKKPEDAEIKPQDPDHGVSPKYPGSYPGLVPGSNPGQYDEQTNRGAGVYAVLVHVAGLPLNYLIPLTYHVPMTRPSKETEAGGENQAQGGQRQVVVRRFEIAFQLDILLILKLAAVIYLFNQDGSRQRLAVLVIFATIIYLYQTGAFASFIPKNLRKFPLI